MQQALIEFPNEIRYVMEVLSILFENVYLNVSSQFNDCTPKAQCDYQHDLKRGRSSRTIQRQQQASK